jgi:hypothetical protein
VKTVAPDLGIQIEGFGSRSLLGLTWFLANGLLDRCSWISLHGCVRYKPTRDGAFVDSRQVLPPFRRQLWISSCDETAARPFSHTDSFSHARFAFSGKGWARGFFLARLVGGFWTLCELSSRPLARTSLLF